MVLMTYPTSEGSGEPVHPRSLARAFAVRNHEVWEVDEGHPKNLFILENKPDIYPQTHGISCEFKSHLKSNLNLSKNNKNCCKSYLFCQSIPEFSLMRLFYLSIQNPFSLFNNSFVFSNDSLLELHSFQIISL